jgi:hypothetical protein
MSKEVRITDKDIRDTLKADLKLHLEVFREASNLEEVRALRGAISYYSTIEEDAAYAKEFLEMWKQYVLEDK